jgi:hypothetical protein
VSTSKMPERVVGPAISMVTSLRAPQTRCIPLSFRNAKEAFHYRSRPYLRARCAVKGNEPGQRLGGG